MCTSDGSRDLGALGSLDAFGDDAHPQVSGELDDSMDERGTYR